MANPRKLKPAAVPKFFNELLTKAGVTPTSADPRKVFDAFERYCETPIECTSELIIFAANDTHELSWWSEAHIFKFVFERGFYEAAKGSDICHTSNIEIQFPSTTATRKIRITRQLEGLPSVGGYDAAQLKSFFSDIENDLALWKVLSASKAQTVTSYAGER